MHLTKEEEVVKVYHHHPLPFFWKALQLSFISFPFFFMARLFQASFTPSQTFYVYGGIALFFLVVIAYFGLMFYLDKLVVTNYRLIHINWISLFSREEKEIGLDDAFDIETKEKGLLSYIKIFDYGTFRIESESSKSPIIFDDAGDPEGIKDFIYHLEVKPSKIRPISHDSEHDSTRKKFEEKGGVPPSEQ